MYKYIIQSLLGISSMLIIVGCGGSTDNNSNPPPEENLTIQIPVESKEGGAHFLTHATYGSRLEDIEALHDLGGYILWMNRQFKKTPSNHLDWVNRHVGSNLSVDILREAFYNAWYSIAVNAEDQLRQRVTLALSEIVVVSLIGIESGYAAADYYDLLATHAFGNYRDILYHTAKHPAMGIYLSTWGNEKEHTTANGTVVHADENFAREILQLFSIGLVQLQPNGEPELSQGQPIPTYTQKDIEEFAKVYTGWTTDNGSFYFLQGPNTLSSISNPMIAYEQFHDTRQKTFSDTFNYAYQQPQQIPGGLTADGDLNYVIDIIFNHPNVGPFISKQLIQRLVTSNPSSEYVARVTSKFNDNGEGIRGDMKAVITAILTDEEALYKYKSQRTDLDRQGKLREQLVRIASVMRTFHAQGSSSINSYKFYDFKSAQYRGLHIQPLTAPSVFNYFPPTYRPSGVIQENGLVAPEFKTMAPLKLSEFGGIMLTVIGLTDYLEDQITLDLSYEQNLLDTQGAEAFIEHLNLILMSGQMSSSLKNKLIDYADNKKTANDIVGQIIALIVLSAEYAIER